MKPEKVYKTTGGNIKHAAFRVPHNILPNLVEYRKGSETILLNGEFTEEELKYFLTVIEGEILK